MLNYNSPINDQKEYSEIIITEVEPIIKLNLRGKKRDFMTKIGKELSIIPPSDPNSSSSNEKFNILWLSPDEWMLYSNDKSDLNNTNGFTIALGQIDSSGTVTGATTSDSLTDPINYFYITSTSSATSGGVSGGGANTSAGPVTLGVVNG